MILEWQVIWFSTDRDIAGILEGKDYDPVDVVSPLNGCKIHICCHMLSIVWGADSYSTVHFMMLTSIWKPSFFVGVSLLDSQRKSFLAKLFSQKVQREGFPCPFKESPVLPGEFEMPCSCLHYAKCWRNRRCQLVALWATWILSQKAKGWLLIDIKA